MRFAIVIALAVIIALGAVMLYSEKRSPARQAPVPTEHISMSFTLRSRAFSQNALIPKEYTCDGKDLNPPLEIENPPEKAKSFVLIMDDPDAPGGVFVHWVVFNIPVETSVIEEGKEPPGISGRNSWGKSGYGGPCPPSGTHRYVFTLYALDTELSLKEGSGKEEVHAALEEHIVSEARLIGLYRRR